MQFQTLADAEAKAAELGEGYEVKYLYPSSPITEEERLGLDIDFCNNLINCFLQDNRIEGVTTLQGEALMVKFSTTLSFAQVGAVNSVKEHLQAIEVDDVFTEERKQKYISKIDQYLGQF